MKLIYILIFCGASTGHSQNKNVSKPVKVHLETRELDYPVERIEGIEFETRYTRSKDRLLAPSEREELFRRAGLSKDLKNMDHFEKDLLMIRSKEYPLESYLKHYPTLPGKKLRALRKLFR